MSKWIIKCFNLGLFFLLCISLFYCSTSVTRVLSKKQVKSLGITDTLIRSQDFRLQFSQTGQQSLHLKYLGCGGFYLGAEGNSILIDPYFSYIPFLSIPFKKIQTKPKNVNAGLSDLRDEIFHTTEAILVAHAHYDHMMDVPLVFHEFIDSTNVNFKILGSKSMKKILGSVIDEKYLKNIADQASNHKQSKGWIPIGDGTIRILPIIASHGPHWRFIWPVRLFKGEAKSIKGYNSPMDKTCAGKWKVGETFSFLVDIMDGNYIQFRIFIQSSAALPPEGFFEKALLDEHKVDLAILGGASFQYVKNYPSGIIKYLEPDKIIICHWEDFFNPYNQEPKRFVRFTNFKKLILKLELEFGWLTKDGEQKIFFPDPGVNMSLTY